MEVNICYYPPERAIFGTDSEATHPFHLEGEIPYIVEMTLWDTQMLQELCTKDLNGLENYPIYSLAEFLKEDQQELEEMFQKHNIQFEFFTGSKRNMFYVKVVIQTPHQFEQYFLYLFWNSSNHNNLSLWSLRQDVFQLKEKEYESDLKQKRKRNNRTYYVRRKWIVNDPYVTLDDNSTMFWIGYDGAYITAFSNDRRYATIESLQKTILKNFDLTLGEY